MVSGLAAGRNDKERSCLVSGLAAERNDKQRMCGGVGATGGSANLLALREVVLLRCAPLAPTATANYVKSDWSIARGLQLIGWLGRPLPSGTL